MPGVLPLPEPAALPPLFRVFPRRLLLSELVPGLVEPPLADPDPPCDPVLGDPVAGDPARGEPVLGEPVLGDPVPEPVPEPELLPAPWAKTKEEGVSAANNIANCSSIFSYASLSTLPWAGDENV